MECGQTGLLSGKYEAEESFPQKFSAGEKMLNTEHAGFHRRERPAQGTTPASAGALKNKNQNRGNTAQQGAMKAQPAPQEKIRTCSWDNGMLQ